MRRIRLAVVLVAVVLGLTSTVLTAPAQASPPAVVQSSAVLHGSAVVVSPLYAPGGASAIRPSYDPYTGKIVYKCVFAGWYPGHTVYWTCSLWTTTGVRVDSHSGSFGGGTYETPYFYFPGQVGKAYCSDAYAYSSDGGSSGRKCQ